VPPRTQCRHVILPSAVNLAAILRKLTLRAVQTAHSLQQCQRRTAAGGHPIWRLTSDMTATLVLAGATFTHTVGNALAFKFGDRCQDGKEQLAGSTPESTRIRLMQRLCHASAVTSGVAGRPEYPVELGCNHNVPGASSSTSFLPTGRSASGTDG
jgi:hypothetical protein